MANCEETAYPMGLAKLLANCIAMALISLGVKAPEEALHQLKSTSKITATDESCDRCAAKGQSNSSLVPTFKARIKF